MTLSHPVRLLLSAAVLVVFATSATAFAEEAPTPPADAPEAQPEAVEKAPAAPEPKAIDECISCHQKPGMKPAYVGDDGVVHDLYVDPQRFSQSVHYKADMTGCTDCHDTGFDTYPHGEHDKLGCIDCHDDQAAEFEAITKETLQSVHYKSDKVTFNCTVCHASHYMKKARQMTLAEKNGMCIKCHNDRFNTSGMTLAQRHDWHPLAALHLNKTACITCHTQPEKGVSAIAFKHKILGRKDASRDCTDCHKPEGKMLHYLIDIGEEPTLLSDEELLNQLYLTGSTRIPALDILGLLLLAAAFAGTLGHGALRALAAMRRSK